LFVSIANLGGLGELWPDCGADKVLSDLGLADGSLVGGGGTSLLYGIIVGLRRL